MSPAEREEWLSAFLWMTPKYRPLIRAGLSNPFNLDILPTRAVDEFSYRQAGAGRLIVFLIDEQQGSTPPVQITYELGKRIQEAECAICFVGEPSEQQMFNATAFACSSERAAVIIETTPGREGMWAGFLAAFEVDSISYVFGEARP